MTPNTPNKLDEAAEANGEGVRKTKNIDRNGDPIVGDILDIIDEGDSNRYAVAVRVATYVRQQLEAKIAAEVERRLKERG